MPQRRRVLEQRHGHGHHHAAWCGTLLFGRLHSARRMEKALSSVWLATHITGKRNRVGEDGCACQALVSQGDFNISSRPSCLSLQPLHVAALHDCQCQCASFAMRNGGGNQAIHVRAGAASVRSTLRARPRRQTTTSLKTLHG